MDMDTEIDCLAHELWAMAQGRAPIENVVAPMMVELQRFVASVRAAERGQLVRPLVEKLAGLARSHYGCEDSWYSCPKHEDGTANHGKTPGECDCGADEHNAVVDSLTAELLRTLGALMSGEKQDDL